MTIGICMFILLPSAIDEHHICKCIS